MTTAMKYTQEFKLAVTSNNITEVARSLGIPSSTLYTWVTSSKKDDIIIQSSDGKTSNKITAAAYFAQELS